MAQLRDDTSGPLQPPCGGNSASSLVAASGKSVKCNVALIMNQFK